MAIHQLKQMAEEQGAIRYVGVATEAFRLAKNGKPQEQLQERVEANYLQSLEGLSYMLFHLSNRDVVLKTY